VFAEEALNTIAANAVRLLTLTAQLDGESKFFGGPPATKRKRAAPPSARNSFGVEFQMTALPAPVDILVGDVKKELNARSGREMSVMTDMATPVSMKDYGTFEATREVPMPRGWLIPRPHAQSGRYSAAIDRLRWHGIQIQRASANGQVDVERFIVQTVTKAERTFQGHQEARIIGKFVAAKLSVQEGCLFIPAAQPLARLAFYLLEPESDDGLVTWNLIEAGLGPGETYPVYRVMNLGSMELAP
jgi:hypothetical protein